MNDFGKFMTEVVNRADRLSFRDCGRALSDKYEAPSTVLKMIGAVAGTGWMPYSAMSGLMANPSYFAFVAALALFIISPLGLVVVGALIYWGGQDALKLLYNNRTLVKDVKTVGDKYKELFEKCTSDAERDNLANQAAEELYRL